MTGSVLVLNAGSSSLKYQVLDADERTVAGGTVERVDETGWDEAFDEVTLAMAEAGVDPGDLLAVGHRVVHGGGGGGERGDGGGRGGDRGGRRGGVGGGARGAAAPPFGVAGSGRASRLPRPAVRRRHRRRDRAHGVRGLLPPAAKYVGAYLAVLEGADAWSSPAESGRTWRGCERTRCAGCPRSASRWTRTSTRTTPAVATDRHRGESGRRARGADRRGEPRSPDRSAPCWADRHWSAGLAGSAVVRSRSHAPARRGPATRRRRAGPRRARGSRPRPATRCRPSPGAAPRPAAQRGHRSMTSMTRWKRSRLFIITMSNGVVVVPSSCTRARAGSRGSSAGRWRRWISHG